VFANAKTRGFNIEDTHMTDPSKLSTLLSIVAMAMAWAYRCASQIKRGKAIRRKTHRQAEKSGFRVGFDTLRR